MFRAAIILPSQTAIQATCVNNLSKIRECLDLAVTALAIGNVSVAAVTRIRENVTGTSAASETAQAKPSVPDSETTEDLPQLTSVSGSFLGKAEFVASLKDQQVRGMVPVVAIVHSTGTQECCVVAKDGDSTEMSVAKDGKAGCALIRNLMFVCIVVSYIAGGGAKAWRKQAG